MTGSSSGPDGGIRKKMRKGTHSCFECRRRKIRCIFSPENPSVCNECFARGSKCIDQEHADSDVVLDQRRNLRERVAKLESLVETLLDDKSDKTTAAEALKKLSSSDFPPTPRSHNDSPRAPLTVPEMEEPSRSGDNERGANDAPLLSLFDNVVLSRVESRLSSITTANSPGGAQSQGTSPAEQRAWSISHENEPAYDEANARKNDRIRQIFIKALPPWEELVGICREKEPYWEMFKHKCPSILGGKTSFEQFATVCLAEKSSPSQLGTLILSVSACAPDRGESLDRCLALVDRYIISDEDYMCTLEGLECSMLQAKCYSDLGQARNSWLVFRRAMTSAQLIGLHRNHSSSPEAEAIWWNLFMGDRMTSLMLGLPYAINLDHVDTNVHGKDLWEHKSPESFMLKCAVFAGQVTDRLLSVKQSSYAYTMELDQAMDQAVSSMPEDFWRIPPSSTIDSAKTLVEWQVRLLTQMCFNQTRVYLHMPFMLQSATNPRFEYSRKVCFDGAREMLVLYHTLRTAGFAIYQCKVVDFVGFTASIVLLLGLLGYGRLSGSHDPNQDATDWHYIETSMAIFKEAANEKGGKVAEQSYQVLKKFYSVKNFDCQASDDNDCGPAKIVIPYFGTISIKRGQKFHYVPTPGPSTVTSSTNGQNTPASTTTPSFQQSSSSGQSPATQSCYSSVPRQQQQSSMSSASQSMSSMDPFIAYDAGFYMPPGGTFDSFGQDEPLANHMSPPDSLSTSKGSASTSALSGLNLPQGGNGPMAQAGPGFPWGMPTMDIDQDWSWFMNESQNWQGAGNHGQGMGANEQTQFAMLP